MKGYTVENYQVIARMPDGLPACVGSSPSLVQGDVPGEVSALALLKSQRRAVLVRSSDGAVLEAVGLDHAPAFRLAAEWAEHRASLRGAA